MTEAAVLFSHKSVNRRAIPLFSGHFKRHYLSNYGVEKEIIIMVIIEPENNNRILMKNAMTSGGFGGTGYGKAICLLLSVKPEGQKISAVKLYMVSYVVK